VDLQCAYTGNGNIAAPRDVVDAWICNVQTRKTESTLHRGMSVVDRILHTREMETTLHRGRCALLCGSVPAHEEKTLHGAASQATKAFAELRRGQCIIKLIAAALGSVILLLSKKPRGKHSKDTMIATLFGFAEARDAIATGESANEKAASAAAIEAVERAVDGQPAGKEESVRVPGGERGRKRRSAWLLLRLGNYVSGFWAWGLGFRVLGFGFRTGYGSTLCW